MTQLKRSIVIASFVSASAFAQQVTVTLPAPPLPPPPAVRVQVAPAPVPAPVVVREQTVVRETVVVKGRHDHGKHKGQWKR